MKYSVPSQLTYRMTKLWKDSPSNRPERHTLDFAERKEIVIDVVNELIEKLILLYDKMISHPINDPSICKAHKRKEEGVKFMNGIGWNNYISSVTYLKDLYLKFIDFTNNTAEDYQSNEEWYFIDSYIRHFINWNYKPTRFINNLKTEIKRMEYYIYLHDNNLIVVG